MKIPKTSKFSKFMLQNLEKKLINFVSSVIIFRIQDKKLRIFLFSLINNWYTVQDFALFSSLFRAWKRFEEVRSVLGFRFFRLPQRRGFSIYFPIFVYMNHLEKQKSKLPLVSYLCLPIFLGITLLLPLRIHRHCSIIVYTLQEERSLFAHFFLYITFLPDMPEGCCCTSKE